MLPVPTQLQVSSLAVARAAGVSLPGPRPIAETVAAGTRSHGDFPEPSFGVATFGAPGRPGVGETSADVGAAAAAAEDAEAAGALDDEAPGSASEPHAASAATSADPASTCRALMACRSWLVRRTGRNPRPADAGVSEQRVLFAAAPRRSGHRRSRPRLTGAFVRDARTRLILVVLD
ncbi:hypothetical protein GCM10007977_060140 [Dactylosporangium sucinum]|uniref:Uncharacterized protein n=1 Tax=Dactylosporangium sucinum TaxID=1424081 RepID=A0A917U2F3_9ACTN|nr:hypothetical protein GCM10007977_060140 [Dactylosporangium sucinum]